MVIVALLIAIIPYSSMSRIRRAFSSEGQRGGGQTRKMRNDACFAPSIPILKRAKNACASYGKEDKVLHSLVRKERVAVDVKQSRVQSLQMTLQDTAAPAEMQNSILPKGVFTICFKVSFPEEISFRDRKVILSDYGRKSCAEPGVLRCDALYQITSRGEPKNKFFELWVSFVDARAYMDHEKTSHAAKLRLCLHNPSGGDNSVMLTKLAHDLTLLRTVWPEVEEWRSPFGDSNTEEGPPKQDSRTESSKDVRSSLSKLISNVGLENVRILISTASATSQEASRKLRKECEAYLKQLERGAGTVRTVILVDRHDPFQITLMSVHDPSDEDGACFDLELGRDYITDYGWQCRQCSAIFPDKVGWEKPLSKELQQELMGSIPNKPPSLIPEEEEKANDMTKGGSLQKTETQQGSGSLAKKNQLDPSGPKLRLLQGPSAFNSLKKYVREIAKAPVGDVRVALFGGWNGARLHFIICQLEYDARIDQGRIDFECGPQVVSTEVTTSMIRKGVAFIKEYKPDLIIGSGGGGVMDYVKTVGKLVNVSDEELESILAKIDDAADREVDEFSFVKTAASFPIFLLPSTVGSCSLLTEACILTGRKKNGSRHRMFVDILDEADLLRQVGEKTVLIDSRLVSPIRLDGFHAAQGAMQLMCHGIDYFIAMHEHPKEQGMVFVLQGFAQGFNQIIPALREPFKATGQSRDPLINARTSIALAIDTVQRMGICLRMTLAVLDALVDGRHATVFRMVFIRLTIAVLQELRELEPQNRASKFILKNIVKVTETGDEDGLVKKMLEHAEDCDVHLLKEMGMARRTIPSIAARVGKGIENMEGSSSLECVLADRGRLERILHSALNQEYEL